MKPILVVLAMALVAGFAFAQAEQKELVLNGEVVSVSAADRTLSVKEIAETPQNPPPGTMQSGVVRPFVVNDETKLLAKAGSIQLADIRAGDRVTIHYRLDSGKNVAKSITVTAPATD
jgi:hypothetical protein